MKKIALMVIVGLVAASPAVAASKKKMKHAAKPAVAAKVDTNEASRRLVVDAIPSLLPTPLKIIYFSQPQNKK